MIVLDNKYEIGETVYLKTDSNQLTRMLYAIKYEGNGSLLYLVICGTTTSEHYDFEISKERDMQLVTQ